jgi:hypothetical protein
MTDNEVLAMAILKSFSGWLVVVSVYYLVMRHLELRAYNRKERGEGFEV